jgi:hypothetical protein
MSEWTQEYSRQAIEQGWCLINVAETGLNEIQRIDPFWNLGIGCRFQTDAEAQMYVLGRSDAGDSMAWLAMFLHDRDYDALREWHPE